MGGATYYLLLNWNETAFRKIVVDCAYSNC